MNKWNLSVVVVLMYMGAASANAGIASTSATVGGFEVLGSPPADLQNNAYQSDNARIFVEQSNFVLPQAITVDTVTPGLYDAESDYTGKSVVIPQGWVVDVYLIHLDSPTFGEVDGTIVFDQDIIGLIPLRDSLFATNPVLGAAGTTYQTPGAVGVHDSAEDAITLHADLRTLDLHLTQEGQIDSMRVIVGVPEPGMSSLALVMALAATQRRGRVG